MNTHAPDRQSWEKKPPKPYGRVIGIVLIAGLALAGLVFTGFRIYRQGNFLEGRIISEAGLPVIGAVVAIDGGIHLDETNQDGYFRIPNVPADGKTLVIEHSDFIRSSFELAGFEDTIEIELSGNQVLIEGAREVYCELVVALKKAKSENGTNLQELEKEFGYAKRWLKEMGQPIPSCG